MKIYTKTGDKGQTSLVGGTRVSKSDIRVAFYGRLDELNSQVGFAAALASKNELKEELQEIQNHLFVLQATAACEPVKRQQYKIRNIEMKAVQFLEEKIDLYQADLPALTQFILPGGGGQLSAYLHICRTSVRGIEREMLLLLEQFPDYFSEEVGAFLNRLSDYFFVLARVMNLEEGGEEVFVR